MATVNKSSLRAEFDALKARFESGRRRRDRLRRARPGRAVHGAGEVSDRACHSSAPWVIHANRGHRKVCS